VNNADPSGFAPSDAELEKGRQAFWDQTGHFRHKENEDTDGILTNRQLNGAGGNSGYEGYNGKHAQTMRKAVADGAVTSASYMSGPVGVAATTYQISQELQGLRDLQRIADEVQAAASKGARGRRVIAAVQLSDGTIIVAGSRQYLSRAQQAIVASHGAIYAKGLGHAEVTAIEYARYLGYNVEGAHVAASRPICGACYKYLRVFGTIFASVLKK
jgi:hypothetical protein